MTTPSASLFEDMEADLLERTQELAAAELEIERLRAAMDRLARIGNGDRYGNSDGNMIARDALRDRP